MVKLISVRENLDRNTNIIILKLVAKIKNSTFYTTIGFKIIDT